MGDRKKKRRREEINQDKKGSTWPRKKSKHRSQEEGLESKTISRDREIDQARKEHSRKKDLDNSKRTQVNRNNDDQMSPTKIPTSCKVTRVSNFRYSEIKNTHKRKNEVKSDQIPP